MCYLFVSRYCVYFQFYSFTDSQIDQVAIKRQYSTVGAHREKKSSERIAAVSCSMNVLVKLSEYEWVDMEQLSISIISVILYCERQQHWKNNT